VAAVDPSYAQALKSDALYLRERITAPVDWGDRGITSKGLSPYALHDDAAAECDRQATFLCGSPLVRDRALVPGRRCDLVGKVITIKIARLGYDAGIAVFVLGAEESDSETTLTVLRKL